MTTPLFKVLANAIRLGQPPEPVTAIRALVDAIAHQDAELNELRQRISLLTSRLQFFEAKTARLEAAASLQSGPVSGAAPHSGSLEAQGFVAPQGIPAYAALAAPTYLPKADPLPARPERSERPRSQRPPAFAELPNTDDPRDGEAGGTLVVKREDIDHVIHVVEHDAPYPIAAPGAHASSPESLSGMPFKPAASQPPPPMAQPTPAHGTELHGHDREPAPAVAAAAPRATGERRARERRPPASRDSYSDPYVAIDPDTFASTDEVAAVQRPVPTVESALNPEGGKAAPRSPAQPTGPARRSRIADEPSFDEVLTSVHKRKT